MLVHDADRLANSDLLKQLLQVLIYVVFCGGKAVSSANGVKAALRPPAVASLEQAAQRAGRVSISGDSQTPPGHIPV